VISEIFDLPLEGHYVFSDDWFAELDVKFENVRQLLLLPVIALKWKFPPCPIQ